MKNKILLTFVFFFFLFGLLPLQSQQSFTMKKDIYVAEDEVQDNIIAFGGEVLIEGKVKNSVVAFGGTVIVSGEVGDLVLGFGSEVTLKSSAVVNGDVVSLGGTLEKEFGSIVKGDTIYIETPRDIKNLMKTLFKGPLIPFLIIIKLISVFIWFLLALLMAAFFPRQISLASSQIRKSFWPVFGTGILSIIIYTCLIIFSVFLSFVLIGIPILLSLIIIGLIIKIFGRVVLFYFLGDSLCNAFGKGKASPLLAVTLGLIIVSFITFIPFLGALVSFFLTIIAWGVVIRTKFGVTENWFGRKKLKAQKD